MTLADEVEVLLQLAIDIGMGRKSGDGLHKFSGLARRVGEMEKRDGRHTEEYGRVWHALRHYADAFDVLGDTVKQHADSMRRKAGD